MNRPARSTPPEPPRVGETLAALREQQSLTLDELSRRAGVSKSMLSQIERAQANPTVAVVWRLAHALGVPLAELLGETPKPDAPVIATLSAHETPALGAADARFRLRILGPIELAGRFEWYELSLQPGAALESAPHEPGSREHISVLSGSVDVESGDARSRLKAGDTARYPADRPHAIRNVGRGEAQALLVVIHAG